MENYMFRQYFICRLLALGFLLQVVACTGKKMISKPVLPGQALATFQVAEGFNIEMIAAEPLLSSPVDMEIDEYGRLYVVEMHGYPLDKSGSGNIIQLSDTNGDGIMDKRTVFKDKLVLPNGILRWKKGFIVTDAPNVLYLEDTDQDGKADKTDTLLTGFALTNPQHNMNNPLYGLDNWIYIAHEGAVKTRDFAAEFGDGGTEVHFMDDRDTKSLPVNAGGRSIRFQPDKKWLEMTASRCQFGHSFDEWGNWFGCNNSNQGYHEVIANRYFERNPYLLAAGATQSMSDHLDAAEVFPTTSNPDRQLLTNVGVMTSAAGLTAYLGNAFPPPYNGRVTFITESVSNLVHVDALRDSGVSFAAGRILPNSEFLSSSDAWSRPVNLYVGPDGALYVLDYYRRVIESPEWMSKEAIEEGNLYDGVDRGRIYRITPKAGLKADWMKGLSLGDATTEELIEQLANPNGWWRKQAQRLLVDRRDSNAIPLLKATVNESGSPMARLHALWVLQGMDVLPYETIVRALKDSSAGIRVNGIRLAELHLNHLPQLEQSLWQLEKDPDPKVRFQLLLTLGYLDTQGSEKVRNAILFSDIKDKWVQIAALSGPPAKTAALLDLVLTRYKAQEPAYDALVKRLTEMTGASANPATISALITKACLQSNPQPWQAPILAGLSAGVRNRKDSLSFSPALHQTLVQTFFNTNNDALRNACFKTLQVTGLPDEQLKASAIDKAVAIAQRKTESDERRADAISFISLGDPKPYFNLLTSFFNAGESPRVQSAALHTLDKIPNSTDLCQYLVKEWPQLSASLRDDAIPVFMKEEDKIDILITALEAGKIQPGHVSFNRSVYIMQVKNETLKNRARKIFTKSSQDAKAINKKYQQALELTGNAEKGMTVFLQNCGLCHQVRGEKGVAFGPDLGTIHNWKKEDLLANILDPNLAIYPGFDLWEIKLNSGESLQGIIANETPAAITVKNQGMMDRTINRQDIASLKSLNLSAMPTGLEQKINYQDMADLLAFLRKN